MTGVQTCALPIWGPQDPAVLTTAADLVAHLGDLTVLRAGPVERRVETPDGPRTAIDHLLRATRTA